MKPVLIGLSLGLNVLLLGAIATHPEVVPAPLRAWAETMFGGAEEKPAPSQGRRLRPPPKGWARVYHDDPATLVSRLRQAGFPPEVIRSIVTVQVGNGFNTRIRALRGQDGTVPFWKLKEGFFGEAHQRSQEVSELYRERMAVMRRLFLDDFFGSEASTAVQRRQYGNLDSSKIDLLQRIEDDYRQMNAAVKTATGGITLPEDKAKFDLLAREKEADLAAVLTPEELTEYRLRTSPITLRLRDRSGAFEATEAEFRALFQAQENLNARFSEAGISTLSSTARREIHDHYLRDLHASLGADRFAEYIRESSDEYQQMVRIAERANLPRETPLVLYQLREYVSANSIAIFRSSDLDVAAKRQALQTLAQSTRQAIQQLLGGVAGPAYLKVADRWLPHVEKGAAVSFARAQTIGLITEHRNYSFGAAPDFAFLPQP